MYLFIYSHWSVSDPLSRNIQYVFIYSCWSVSDPLSRNIQYVFIYSCWSVLDPLSRDIQYACIYLQLLISVGSTSKKHTCICLYLLISVESTSKRHNLSIQWNGRIMSSSKWCHNQHTDHQWPWQTYTIPPGIDLELTKNMAGIDLEWPGIWWEWTWNDLECAWNVPGMDLEWTWNGPGMDLEWPGIWREWTWNGPGMWLKKTFLFLTWIPPGMTWNN